MAQPRKKVDLSTLLELIETAENNKHKLVSSYWAVADEFHAHVGSIEKDGPSDDQTDLIKGVIMPAIEKKFGVNLYSFETIVMMVRASQRKPAEERRGDQQFWDFIAMLAGSAGRVLTKKPDPRPNGDSDSVKLRTKMLTMLSTQSAQNDYIARNADLLDKEGKKMVADQALSTAAVTRTLSLTLSRNGETDEHLKILHEALDLLRSQTLKRSHKSSILVREIMEACQSWIK